MIQELLTFWDGGNCAVCGTNLFDASSSWGIYTTDGTNFRLDLRLYTQTPVSVDSQAQFFDDSSVGTVTNYGTATEGTLFMETSIGTFNTHLEESQVLHICDVEGTLQNGRKYSLGLRAILKPDITSPIINVPIDEISAVAISIIIVGSDVDKLLENTSSFKNMFSCKDFILIVVESKLLNRFTAHDFISENILGKFSTSSTV